MKALHRLFILPALALAGLGPGMPRDAASQTAADVGESIGESIDVEIKIVPFYAVNEDGTPVFDLKQDEVELRLDGKPVSVDAFDVFDKSGAGPAAGVAPAAPKGKGPRRHVVLFFDIAFSSARGFEQGRSFAEKVVGEVPDGDLLYLVTHEFTSGLEQRLGPLAANPANRSKVLAELGALKPEIGYIAATTEYGDALAGRGSGTRRGVPSGQNMMAYEPIRLNAQAQLEGTARSLAESMQALADQLQRIHEPKLLVFLSQGIEPSLYWMGSDVMLKGASDDTPNLIVRSQQYTGIHKLYEKPLQQLADSGTMSLFVNLDDQANQQRVNDSSMQHMARASGGLYLGGVDPALVSDRFARSTAAYYEAGFYLTAKDLKPSRGEVEVVVHRPGVRTWSAGSIKTRETWRGLTAEARRMVILDLVEGEAAGRRARTPVRLSLNNLPGEVKGGRSADGVTHVRFEAGWPQELAGRRIDLYNVILEPARSPGSPVSSASPNVLRFDRNEGTRVDGAGALEIQIPRNAALIWGIVAVEPATGRTWLRRFQLQGKP